MVKIDRNGNLRRIAIKINSKPLNTLSFYLKHHDDVLRVC